MTHTLRFDESLATRLELSGGKGANLSLLTQRGFPVPPGFIITAPVYREFITGAGGWLRRVAALPFHDATALRAEGGVLQADLLRLPLPPAAAAEIKQQLGRFSEGTAFSVRSSSTLEDLASAAVAGQQMVPSETAGVGFSINPVSGLLGEIVINANFGLGESVVSGEGEVDQWILDKATRAVLSTNIASKSRQVVSAASGTREVHLAGSDAALTT